MTIGICVISQTHYNLCTFLKHTYIPRLFLFSFLINNHQNIKFFVAFVFSIWFNAAARSNVLMHIGTESIDKYPISDYGYRGKLIQERFYPNVRNAIIRWFLASSVEVGHKVLLPSCHEIFLVTHDLQKRVYLIHEKIRNSVF